MKTITVKEFRDLKSHFGEGPRFGKFRTMTEEEVQAAKIGDIVMYMEMKDAGVPQMEILEAILVE